MMIELAFYKTLTWFGWLWSWNISCRKQSNQFLTLSKVGYPSLLYFHSTSIWLALEENLLLVQETNNFKIFLQKKIILKYFFNNNRVLFVTSRFHNYSKIKNRSIRSYIATLWSSTTSWRQSGVHKVKTHFTPSQNTWSPH
jgi:hypothetical protein